MAVAQGGFDTRRFDVDVQAHENCTFDVTETIQVDFFEERHGIFRDIPYVYGKMRIENVRVAGAPFSLSSEGDNDTEVLRIRIGEKATTVYGPKTYRISYTIVVLPQRGKNHDFLHLDLLPPFWQTPIDSLRLMLTMPKPLDWSRAEFFSGSFGSDKLNEKFHLKTTDRSLVVTAADIDAAQGFTVWCDLPEGYWQGMQDNSWVNGLLIALLVLIPLIMALLWYFKGRDPMVVQTVEFYPPDGLGPLDAIYLLSGKADSKDFLSLIVYFAHKGYLSIEEVAKRRFLLHRQVEPSALEEEPQYVADFFEFLFPDGLEVFDTGENPKLSNYSSTRFEKLKQAKESIERVYRIGDRLYNRSSRQARTFGFVLLVLLLFAPYLITALYVGEFTSNIWYLLSPLAVLAGSYKVVSTREQRHGHQLPKRIFGYLLGLSAIALGFWGIFSMMQSAYSILLFPFILLSYVLSMLFEMIMYARSKESAARMGRILGFKEFIRTAELDRIKMLVEETPDYFFQILPYAYVFGLTDKWIKSFESIDIKEPSWYRSYGDTFHAAGMFYSLSALNTSLETLGGQMQSYEVEKAAYSSSSGVGGGYGGGGGDSW